MLVLHTYATVKKFAAFTPSNLMNKLQFFSQSNFNTFLIIIHVTIIEKLSNKVQLSLLKSPNYRNNYHNHKSTVSFPKLKITPVDHLKVLEIHLNFGFTCNVRAATGMAICFCVNKDGESI